MHWRKVIPQPLARIYCALIRRHRQQRYYARKDGTAVAVYTCLCGQRQNVKVMAANRRIARAARRQHRRGR